MRARPAFLGEPLDRAAERRTDEQWLARALAAPAARAVLVGERGPLLADGRAVLMPIDAARAAGAAGEPLLLGLCAGEPRFALAVPGGLDPAPPGAGFADLREVAGELDPEEGGLLAYATSLVAWHRRHPFCARCGSPTLSGEGGSVPAGVAPRGRAAAHRSRRSSWDCSTPRRPAWTTPARPRGRRPTSLG